MSTRSATIIRQTTYWGETPDTEELMRFYRHCDGYPEGHGLEMAEAIRLADAMNRYPEAWLQSVLTAFFCNDAIIKFEPFGCQHGDLEYLYVVDGTVDYRPRATKGGRLPITISLYDIGCDEFYADAEKQEPIFSGTAYEYIERFGEEEAK
jgi:hypothetical protein